MAGADQHCASAGSTPLPPELQKRRSAPGQIIRCHRVSHHSPASGSIRAEAGISSRRNLHHGAAENHGHLATVPSRCDPGMGLSRLSGQDWPGGVGCRQTLRSQARPASAGVRLSPRAYPSPRRFSVSVRVGRYRVIGGTPGLHWTVGRCHALPRTPPCRQLLRCPFISVGRLGSVSSAKVSDLRPLIAVHRDLTLDPLDACGPPHGASPGCRTAQRLTNARPS